MEKLSELRPAKISIALSLILSAVSVAACAFTGSVLILANAMIFFVLLTGSVFTFFAINQARKFPEENTDDILSRYESLSGFTSAVLSFSFLVVVLVITIIKINRKFEEPPDVLLFFLCLLAYFLLIFISARQESAFKKFNYRIYERNHKDWITTGWIEMAIAAVFFIRLISDKFLPEGYIAWIELGGSVIIALAYFIYKTFYIKSDLGLLLDWPVTENVIFNALSVVSDNIDSICEFKGISARRSGNRAYMEISFVMPYDSTLGAVQEVENKLKILIMEKSPDISIRFYVLACRKDCIYGGQCPVKMASKKKDIREKEE